MALTTRDAAGVNEGDIHRHTTTGRPIQPPAPWTMSPALRDAWTAYQVSLQRINEAAADAARMIGPEAEAAALASDEEALAADPDTDDPTPALDKLAADRRKAAVKRGAAARVADAARDEFERLRWSPDALDPEARERVDKTRQTLDALLTQLEPGLRLVAEWRAAQDWTQGGTGVPDRNAETFASHIRSELAFTINDRDNA